VQQLRPWLAQGTSCMLGDMREQLQTREEFLALIRKKHNGLG
jgi:hypothetical protein